MLHTWLVGGVSGEESAASNAEEPRPSGAGESCCCGCSWSSAYEFEFDPAATGQSGLVIRLPDAAEEEEEDDAAAVDEAQEGRMHTRGLVWLPPPHWALHGLHCACGSTAQ